MKGKISFEEALKQLEDIVEKLEDGELPLDESIKMYQKGMELSQICSSQLSEAEKKITMLIKKDNKLEEVPFVIQED